MWQRGGFSEEKTDYMGSERGFTMTYCSLSVQTNTISQVIEPERGVYESHLVKKLEHLNMEIVYTMKCVVWIFGY